MSTYNILPYSYKQARKLGVQIKQSNNPLKKIDVFKDDEKISSIGDIKYKDYPQYLKEDKDLAEKRRKLYKKRHLKTRKIIGSNSYYADRILW